jgi:hypothetical protein
MRFLGILILVSVFVGLMANGMPFDMPLDDGEASKVEASDLLRALTPWLIGLLVAALVETIIYRRKRGAAAQPVGR